MLVGKYYEGIWHTSICTYGKEFYYGDGMCFDQIGQTPFGVPTKELLLGETDLEEEQFMKYLGQNKDEWTADKYNVIKHNCNNFTDMVSKFLVKKGIPSDIISQPSEFLSTPLGPMIEPMITKMQDSLKLKSNQIFKHA